MTNWVEVYYAKGEESTWTARETSNKMWLRMTKIVVMTCTVLNVVGLGPSEVSP